MDIVNSFYGAITGFWIVFAFKEEILNSWLSLLPLFILFFIMYSLKEFVTLPKNSSKRVLYLVSALTCSFIVSAVIQIIYAPEIPLIKFICLPKTWLFTIIIILWILSIDPSNIKIFYGGE